MEEQVLNETINEEVVENVAEAFEVIDEKVQLKFIGKAAIALGVTALIGSVVYRKVIRPRREKKGNNENTDNESEE